MSGTGSLQKTPSLLHLHPCLQRLCSVHKFRFSLLPLKAAEADPRFSPQLLRWMEHLGTSVHPKHGGKEEFKAGLHTLGTPLASWTSPSTRSQLLSSHTCAARCGTTAIQAIRKTFLKSICFKKKKKAGRQKIGKDNPFQLAQDFDKIHLAFSGIIFTYLHKTCNTLCFSNQAPFCSLPQDETHHYLKKQGQIVQLTASICQNVSPQHFFLNKHEEIRWPLNHFLTCTKSTEIRRILWKELYNFSTQCIFS